MQPWVCIVGGLAAAWGVHELSRWRPTIVHTDTVQRRPSGPEWQLEHQPYHWPRTDAGHRAFTRYLARKLAELSILPPAAIPLFIAHVARETGWGSAVWCNNFGNEKQYWHGPWFALEGQPYMGFETADQGIAHAVHRVRRQWPGPWRKLLAGDPSWYGDLGRGGYYEGAPDQAQAEYDGTVTRVRSYLRA